MKKLLRSSTFFFLFAVSVHSQAQIVTLDCYFNRELHQNAAGRPERFHYLWEDTTNTGFSNWGAVLKNQGAQLHSLNEAPTQANLKGTAVYIIVDPDTKKESASPHYITTKDIDQIVRYVKNGGVLVLMANDSTNVELPHFNQLAAKFGLHFNNDLHNHVINDEHFADGGLTVSGNPFFKTATKIFMKDISTLTLSGNAKSILKDRNAVILATTKYGRGTVFAVGDPWLYNEYLNGRLPAEYENDKAANDVTRWLLKQIPKKNTPQAQR
jgi:hypothetical protein